MRIVLLSGKQGSGKSTIQKKLIEQASERGFDHGVTVNFADALYRLHDEILNTMEDDFLIPRTTDKDGVLLQLLGTEWGRTVYGEDIWINILKNRIKMHVRSSANVLVVIADCRFKNEFHAFPEALRVRLHAPAAIRKDRTTSWRPNQQHPSEIDLDEYDSNDEFDLYLRTDGPTTEESVNEIFMHLNNPNRKRI